MKQQRINLDLLVQQYPGMNLTEYYSLLQTREKDSEWGGHRPVSQKIPRDKRTTFRKLRDITKIVIPGESTVGLQREVQKLLISMLWGWAIPYKEDEIWAVVLAENNAFHPELGEVICYWSEENRYTLLLSWGWNWGYFLNERDNKWGHEQCSYKITGLSRDEVLIIHALVEAEVICQNYWDAYHQIECLLRGEEIIPAWNYHDQWEEVEEAWQDPIEDDLGPGEVPEEF